MKYINMIRSWGVSSLLTFLLYEVIWSVTSHTWPLHDGWLVMATDLLYCSVFVASSMVMCGVLSRIRFFRSIDFWSQTWLSVLTVTTNLLLAFVFELAYNSVLETDDTALVQSSLYVFCAVATLFTLVHHTSRFYRIILRQKDELASLQKNVLKSKLDPHFVFNSLSTLTELIHESPRDAEQYTIQFSRIYRHLLSTLDHSTVTVGESLQIINDYVAMQKYRVDGDIEVRTNLPESIMQRRLFPLALQTLVENAIKHNAICKGGKLMISISLAGKDWIAVGNLKEKKNTDCHSMGIGLQTLRERYRLDHLPEPVVEETDNYYEVRIRLIDKEI